MSRRGVAVIALLNAPAFQFTQQVRYLLRQGLAGDSTEFEFQMRADRLCNGGALRSFTSSRVAPPLQSFVWHGAFSLKGDEPRHNQTVPQNLKILKRWQCLERSCVGAIRKNYRVEYRCSQVPPASAAHA